MLPDSDEDILLTVRITRVPHNETNYTLPWESLPTNEQNCTEHQALGLGQNQITNLLLQNTNQRVDLLDDFEKLQGTVITQHDISNCEKCSICQEDFELNQIAK